ncbi:hypothetical protein ELQ39_26180 [Streptomyces sp. GB4-14]|nr:hypothetical protein [Streptomyces sp. GB4-14]
MLEFLQDVVVSAPSARAGVGTAASREGCGSRDDISPRPQEGSQPPELGPHHAAEPGVNGPTGMTGEGLVQRPTNQDTWARL